MDQLDRALRDVRTQHRQRIAVILIDIARFKLVNDMLGHTAGDELMVQAARRFEKSAAAVDGILARWGGDQFAILILDVASEEAALVVAAGSARGAAHPDRAASASTRGVRRRRCHLRRLRASAAPKMWYEKADLALSRREARQPGHKVALYAASMARPGRQPCES